jgi:hypothetical protein
MTQKKLRLPYPFMHFPEPRHGNIVSPFISVRNLRHTVKAWLEDLIILMMIPTRYAEDHLIPQWKQILSVNRRSVANYETALSLVYVLKTPVFAAQQQAAHID